MSYGVNCTSGRIVPLAVPVLALAAGILYGTLEPWAISPWLGVGLFLIPGVWFTYRFRNLSTLAAIIFMILGMVLTRGVLNDHTSDNHISRFADGHRYRIRCRIASYPRRSGDVTRYQVQAETISGNGPGNVQVTGLIRLSVYGQQYDLGPGMKIQYTGTIKRIRNFQNPGSFDYCRYMTLQGISGTSWVNVRDLLIVSSGQTRLKDRFQQIIHGLRERFQSHVYESMDNKDSASVLCALVLGTGSEMGTRLRSVFSRTGTNHLLAISGLHFSAVCLVAYFLFNRFLSFSKILLIRGLSGKIAAGLTLIPLVSYGCVSGFSPSAQRALIMILVFMAAKVMDRESDTMNTLAAAGLVILILDPGALMSVAFQLSFCAVASIIMGLRLADQYRDPSTRGPGRTIFNAFLVAGFATLGTQPLVSYYFNMVSFVGIPVNMVLLPIATFVVLPACLASFFFFPVFPYISDICLSLAGFVLSPCLDFLETIANLPCTWTRTVTPEPWEIVCYYLLIIGGIGVVKRRLIPGIALVCLAACIILATEGFWLVKRFFNTDLELTVLDVGQGSSILLALPGGKRILVDGGGFSRTSAFDPGESIVAPFLWRNRILDLDAVILTHPESDHMNGLIFISENFNIGQFIKNCDSRSTKAYSDLMEILMNRGIPVVLSGEMEKHQVWGNVTIDFFNPPGGCPESVVSKRSFNDNSLVFKVSLGLDSILFPGDITAEAEAEMAARADKRLESRTLIAPHHGSKTSSSLFFLDKVHPERVIVSCGWNNPFGFPHHAVLDRYQGLGISILRTDMSGAVHMVFRGDGTPILTCMGD
ncbi:MAG: DNA internalization-related competence protein ComEC/Rec2 [Pseudomonadota bacterium]